MTKGRGTHTSSSRHEWQTSGIQIGRRRRGDTSYKAGMVKISTKVAVASLLVCDD